MTRDLSLPGDAGVAVPVPPSGASLAIRLSWDRCRQRGCNPLKTRCCHVLAGPDLSALLLGNAELVEVTREMLHLLQGAVADSGFLIVLADPQGYVLQVLGSPELREEALELNLVPGALWDEAEMGTNGVGTVLAAGHPLMVVGAEHYCQALHTFVSAGAPVFWPAQQPLGVIAVFGPRSLVHEHTLAMVVAMASSTENCLRVHRSKQELESQNARLRTVFESVSDGLLALDCEDRIAAFNPRCEQLLGWKGARLGQGIEELLPALVPALESLRQGREVVEWEFPLGDVQSCLVSVRRVGGGGNFQGAVVVFREWKAVQRLTQRMSGAEAKFTFEDLVGASPDFRAAVELARRAAATSATVLLEGETGTGKELFAQAIHNASRRALGPFVAVNCGVIPRELVASELFGYVEGAFTGARRGGRPGKFELADGGTLFLDEVSEMSLEMQVALLRVLQERKVVRVGGDRVIPVDVRVIAATNRDLRAEVERGRFRQDLYFRLNVFHIRVPALRHRRGDIPLLVNYFLERYCRGYGRPMPVLHPEAVTALQAYPWPGNVRELQNVVERLVVTLDKDQVSPAHLPPELRGWGSQAPVARRKRGRLRELQHAEMMRVLAECGGNVSRAASELGVARSTIYRRLTRSG